MRALHLLDQHAHALRLLERERVVLGQLGHEAQHREVGVAVHEHVLDELIRREAVDRIGIAARALREARRGSAPSTGRRCARHLPAGSTMWVCTSKMNSSPASALLGGGRLELGLIGQDERAAGVAARRERLVEGEQRGRGAAQRLQERAPRHARALGVGGDPLARQRIGRSDGPAHRDRPELAVRGRRRS